MDGLTTLLPALIFILVVAGILILSWAVPVRLWIEAIFAGVRVSIGDLIGMRLRKVSPGQVVRPLIAATKAGLNLATRPLEELIEWHLRRAYHGLDATRRSVAVHRRTRSRGHGPARTTAMTFGGC